MVGVIVNRYSTERREVEIIELDSRVDGSRHLVNAREYRGGKVWLNTFTADQHVQTDVLVNRNILVPVAMLQAA
jgi:hypothetical protein